MTQKPQIGAYFKALWSMSSLRSGRSWLRPPLEAVALWLVSLLRGSSPWSRAGGGVGAGYCHRTSMVFASGLRLYSYAHCFFVSHLPCSAHSAVVWFILVTISKPQKGTHSSRILKGKEPPLPVGHDSFGSWGKDVPQALTPSI